MAAEGACRCEVAGESFELLSGKAVFWKRSNTLLVADLHLGKSAAFRAAGLAVPEGIEADLARLGALLDETAAGRLLVLGDVFHAPEGQTLAVRKALGAWRGERGDVEMVVTRGNHDRECDALLRECEIELVDSLEEGGFVFEHEVEPGDAAGVRYRIGGHVHPAVRIKDRTGSFRLPCFWFGEGAGVLPAFGGFTGTHVIERVDGDRVYAVAEDRVVAI